jgi:hypothetical protein
VRLEFGGQCCVVWWFGREATRSGTRCSAGGAKVVARVDSGKAVRGDILNLALRWCETRQKGNISWVEVSEFAYLKLGVCVLVAGRASMSRRKKQTQLACTSLKTTADPIKRNPHLGRTFRIPYRRQVHWHAGRITSLDHSCAASIVEHPSNGLC